MGAGIEADLVILNGTVITVDPDDTIAEAVAVIGNRIVGVGKTEEIEELAGEGTKRIDLEGRTLIPGLIDAHMHLVRARDPRYVDVRTPPLTSIEEILQAVEEKADKSPKGRWIVGRVSYSPDHYVVEKRYATRWELDGVAPDNPVILPQHTSVANSRALELAGITKDTPDPPGGRIWKDPETGEPDGQLTETAGKMVRALIPPPELGWLKEGTVDHGRWMVEHGITTTHACGPTTPDAMRALQQLRAEGRLPLRVLAALRVVESEFDLKMLTCLGLENNFGDDWLKITGIKMSVDGGMTGKAAKVYEPYVGEPENTGVIRIPQEQLDRIVLEGQRAGLRSLIHAIGDEAYDMTLRALEKALSEMPVEDHRHRIEHGGNNWNTPERLERVRELGVILATNPHFISRIGDAYRSYLGDERMGDAFRFRTLLDMGIRLTAGADADYPPLEGIQCCVTKTTRDGHAFTPEEGMTPLEAIRLFTMDNAYGGFEEDIKGSIEEGKLADMVILSDNPTTVPADEIKDIKVDMTIIDGSVVYERK